MKIGTNQMIAAAAGVAVLIGAVVASAVGSSPEPVPTLSEARALVSGAWKAGVDHDRAAVCHYGSAQANCRIQLDYADGAWPTDEPEIVCHHELAADGEFSAAYAIRVEGVGSNGAAYASDILAIGTDVGPRLMNPVFWNSTGIAVGHDSGTTFDVCTGSVKGS